MNWCPEESGPACAARVLKDTGNLGLAQGFKSICISMPQLDQNKDNIKGKTWRVTVPRDWGTESITPELEQAGLLFFLLIPTSCPWGNFCWKPLIAQSSAFWCHLNGLAEPRPINLQLVPFKVFGSTVYLQPQPCGPREASVATSVPIALPCVTPRN